ncbi:MAG: M28 family peptidase [bacterium]|nr:M28 family peptidase [bacterium]
MLTKITIVLALAVGFLVIAVVRMTDIAEDAYAGPLPALTQAEAESLERLRNDVQHVSLKIGQRNFTRVSGLENTLQFLRSSIEPLGYKVQMHDFSVHGKALQNLVIEVRGVAVPSEILVVSAHYDSYLKSKSADASASGTAALLELLRLNSGRKFSRTVRFVFCANGEPPWRGTADDGHVRYAEACEAARENVVAAICIGSIGYYSETAGSQDFAFPLNLTYPSTGDFAAVFGAPRSRALVEKVAGLWTVETSFPLQAGAIPGWVPGVPSGGHEAFDAVGIPSVLIGDTREQRFPDVGTAYDLHDRLDYDRMARVVHGLRRVVDELSRAGA